MLCRPARCNSSRRTAPSPQATVSWSSSTLPGAPRAPSQRRPQHLDARAFQIEPGAGKRREAADMIVHRLRWFQPRDAGLVLADLVGISDARSRLWRQGERAPLQRRKRERHQIRPKPRERVVQFARGQIRGYRLRLLQSHGTGIEAFIHPHDGDAALGIARHDGAVDRRSAAPARQQRGMDVEAAERHGIENRLRQDQAIGDDHRGGGAMRAKGGLRLSRLQRRGCQHRQIEAARLALDRRWLQLEATAARRLWRAGVDRGDVVAAPDQLGERWQGEIRGAHEDQAKGHGAILSFCGTMRPPEPGPHPEEAAKRPSRRMAIPYACGLFRLARPESAWRRP